MKRISIEFEYLLQERLKFILHDFIGEPINNTTKARIIEHIRKDKLFKQMPNYCDGFYVSTDNMMRSICITHDYPKGRYRYV